VFGVCGFLYYEALTRDVHPFFEEAASPPYGGQGGGRVLASSPQTNSEQLADKITNSRQRGSKKDPYHPTCYF